MVQIVIKKIYESVGPILLNSHDRFSNGSHKKYMSIVFVGKFWMTSLGNCVDNFCITGLTGLTLQVEVK